MVDLLWESECGGTLEADGEGDSGGAGVGGTEDFGFGEDDVGGGGVACKMVADEGFKMCVC